MTHAILSGYLYPSNYRSRCPRFHACRLTQKCQNYNPHMLDCSLCETKVNPNPLLGGFLAEGEFSPDLQDSIKTVEEELGVSFAHPDGKRQKIGPDITLKWEKMRKATDQLAEFMAGSKAEFDEKIYSALVDPALKSKLGRLE